MNLFTESEAVFSEPCRTYRYWLQRIWNRDRPALGFLMLNPSTADETKNDPTVRRCMDFAEGRGYGGLVVCNVYALRSTDPGMLWKVDDPTGPQNDEFLHMMPDRCSLIVAAWGRHARPDRVSRVIDLVQSLECLKVNSDGSPMHPLYVPGDRVFSPYVRDGKVLR